jgi:Methyltransferase domain
MIRWFISQRRGLGRWVFSWLALLLFSGPVISQEAKSDKKYTFTSTWFLGNIPVWEKVLQPYKGKEGVRYLEIGVFEGRALCWMLDNILTHPTARATGIDIIIRKELLENLRLSGAENKVEIIKGRSQSKLSHFPADSFEIIYIDGSHAAADVLADAVLSWPILSDGGLMIFDDYLLKTEVFPIELRPRIAIDAFVTAHRNNLEIIYSGYTLILRKHKGNSNNLTLGQYEFDWGEKNLYTPGRKELVPLSDKERELITQLFLGRGFAEVKFSPPPEMLQDADFIKLVNRLKLNLFGELKLPAAK